MNKLILNCLLFILLITSGYGQELHFENVQLKDLPSTEVYRILQDTEGYIWMATDAGVCKYDGTNLTTYTTENGLPENVVLSMLMDAKGRIWFNTLSGFFFYYEKGHFITIAGNAQLKKLTTHFSSSFLEANPHFKKAVMPFVPREYFVGENDTLIIPYLTGFIKIPPKDNYRQLIHQYLKSSSELDMQAIIQNKINPSELINIYGSTLRPDSTIQIRLIDSTVSISIKGVIGKYSGMFDPKIGLDGCVYLNVRNVVTAVKNYKTISRYRFATEILKLYIDKDGDLWIGTDRHGLYLFKNGDLSKTPIHILPSLSISSILLDKEGSVWISTLEKGIFQCMNKYVYTFTGKTRDFKTIDKQLHIALESQKILVASTVDSTHLKNIPPINPIPKFCAYAKVNQTEYFSLGEQTYSSKNKKITDIRQNEKDPVTSRFLLNLPDDTLLAVNTLTTFVIHDSKLIRTNVNKFSINSVSELPDKRIILSSRSNDGLFEFKNNSCIPFLPDVKELKTRINCVMIDALGNFWFATNEKGMLCYDTHHHIHLFDKTKGLKSNKVNACIVDGNGDIWCATHFGLSKLTTSKGLEKVQIETYDKNHGIVDLEIEKLAYFDHTLWCGGKTNLFYFNPAHIKKNTTPPVAYINSITAKGKNYPLKDTLFLNYDQNDFHIQYGLISFKKTPTCSFFYKLNGYDNTWKLSNSGDIQYTNISYGTYTLLVYAINNDGVRSNLPQKLTFIIKRPFWFTWWFVILMVILVLLLVYLGAQYWRKRIENRERDKAAINQQLSEFKMTALRSQMNPHFIYNAIGSIQHYILKNEIDQSFNYLSKFSSLIRKVLNNSSSEFITLEDEITTLQLYIDLEQIRFKYPFQFNLQVDEELDMETDIPTMLIQPYIENSIWHGLMPKESEGKLELIFKKADATIHVIIRDNGVGRDKGDLSKKYHVSKGMSLTQQRIQTLENTSKKKFVITIIDLKDEKGNPIGTEVNLIIPFDK
ncbi:MAG TPA: two-component regulator propeller domain-containing protein [Bacteroidia bacterium]|jgi:ligand-binding sensor domain-containing protein|nr:two-component regulator propeller domain-containing protein [Bacteroidia bacterium]